MKKAAQCLRLAATLALVAATSPAAAGPAKLGDYQPKGFLSSYENLKPEEGDSEAFYYHNPAVVKGKYNKLLIDRIKIFLKDDAAYKGIDPAELKELADYFHQAIVKAVSDAYPVVAEPGEDVLHLRIAITDLVPNKPEASVVSLAVPFLWLGEAGAGAAQGKAGSTPFVGEVTVEVEGLDSLTHEQEAAYIETRIGKKYHWTKGPVTAAEDYLKAYSTWAYTRQAMDYWAQQVRERLDKSHGIVPKKK